VTGDAPATLVWLAPAPPDGEQVRALSSWARARGVTLVDPTAERPAPLPVDPSVAETVETLLERARDAIAARDGGAVDRALSSAESALRAHPELPQGAWLMAEVERARSERWRRIAPTDPEAAERAWQRAEALDGGRVAAVAEQSAAGHPAAASVAVEVSVGGVAVVLDGRPAGERPAATRAGPHVVVVTSGGAPVWAAWIESPAGSSTVRAEVPGVPACSADDVQRARWGAAGVDPGGVRCPTWVAATSAPRGAVRVATCEGDRCGPPVEWQAPRLLAEQPSERTHAGAGGASWPSWATWGLAGAGAVAIAVVAVVASGALESPVGQTRFVGGGVRRE
jgi:hypothetical protein